MVLIATVTKKSVGYVQPKLWRIALNMVLTDDGAEVINRDYSVLYRSGESPAAKREVFIALMQTTIDEYKSEQNIFNAPTLDGVVNDVGAGLVV